ncbi:hypothetical protein C1645_819006 [Glomus cerebriforme]|uniref:Uncharacterized protein n=1 Tax=Glomus cerebriforme TaxID=658196 RepID=A0A397TFR7_9GLOM|nr:hypothetical protein C1645_819006 [Glomus cerebriforme]
MAIEAITHKDYRKTDLQLLLKLRANNIKTYIDSPELISYLQDLIPKMARVFDNTDASRSAKKLGLKTVRAKFGKKIYWENGEDTQYRYSKLPSDELLMENLLKEKQTKDTSSSNVNTISIVKDIQDLFDIM